MTTKTKNKSIVVTEDEVILFEDSDEAIDYFKKKRKENPDSLAWYSTGKDLAEDLTRLGKLDGFLEYATEKGYCDYCNDLRILAEVEERKLCKECWFLEVQEAVE